MGNQDDYNFLDITSGWLKERFEEEYSRFPYIGARDKLLQMQKEKSVGRRVLEAVLKRMKITSIVGYITEKIIGWRPSQGSEPNKLAEDLIKVFDEESNKRTIARFLTDIQKKCEKRGRFFATLSVWSQARLSKAAQSSLQDEMIVVTGQLVHRDAIAQYNSLMAQTVKDLPGEWLMADFPPNGMVPANDRFDGKVICLITEKKFNDIFQHYLPFRKDIGWYPCCRVTGFFKEAGYGQSAPSVDLVMAEFRRPKPYQAEGRNYFSFLAGELNYLNWFESRSVVVVASYVLPLLAKGSSIEDFKVSDPGEKAILQKYIALVGTDLPTALDSWYTNA